MTTLKMGIMFLCSEKVDFSYKKMNEVPGFGDEFF